MWEAVSCQISIRRLSILAEVAINPLNFEEASRLEIFGSGYSSDRYLKLHIEGKPTVRTWKLVPVKLQRPIERRLDRGGIDTLVELYGRPEDLSFLAATKGQNLVGLVTWRFEAWNHMLWLCDIRIHKDHRRQGIGGRLLEALYWTSFRVGAGGIMLETQNLNVGAVDFYLSRGFDIVGLNSHLYSLGEDSEPWEVALYLHRSLEI